MSRINDFCLSNNIRIAENPCVSPDFCLDWAHLSNRYFEAGAADKSWPDLTFYDKSRFAISSGQVVLVEDPQTGDHAWFIDGGNPDRLNDGIHLGGQRYAFPATWDNLLTIKNLVQEYQPSSTIFPSATWLVQSGNPSVSAHGLPPSIGQLWNGPCRTSM